MVTETIPFVTVPQYTQVQTIINLVLEGHLPDITKGRLFFQNPAIVADREKAGKVSKSLTNFGDFAPSAIIKDHAFYGSIDKGSPSNSSPIPLTAFATPELKK